MYFLMYFIWKNSNIKLFFFIFQIMCSTLAIIAGAAVNMECIPELLNPIVKPLMESIKRERCQIIQQLAAQYLVKLLDLVRNRNPNPINKIVINLCHLLKSDNDFTPRIVSTLIFILFQNWRIFMNSFKIHRPKWTRV